MIVIEDIVPKYQEKTCRKCQHYFRDDAGGVTQDERSFVEVSYCEAVDEVLSYEASQTKQEEIYPSEADREYENQCADEVYSFLEDIVGLLCWCFFG